MKLSLPAQILIGMFLGALSGLFFGEMIAPLERVGAAFIMLMKMGILPFMSLSLIHSIGSLAPRQAMKLMKKFFLFTFGLWCLMLLTIYTLQLIFPKQNIALYHSSAGIVTNADQKFLELFIPLNPIHAFANDLVPAVALFSILFGFALMRMSSKENFLTFLEVILATLSRITHWITLLAPIGVFALIASTVGTIPFQQAYKLQLYLLAYIGGAVYLSFVLVPLLVSVFTPIRAGKFLEEIRPIILLTFTTGNLLIAVPQLISLLKDLISNYEGNDQENAPFIESLVPITINFPTIGNILALLFPLFLSFFYAKHFSFSDHAILMGVGIPVLFGSAASIVNGISFLVDILHLPIDSMSLLLETMPLTRNFQVMSSAVGVAGLSIVVTYASQGLLQFNWKKCLKFISYSLLSLTVIVGGSILVRGKNFATAEPYSALTMQFQIPSKIYGKGEYIPSLPDHLKNMDTLDRLQQLPVLRVGYNTDNKPFAYFNKLGQLVGYDIAYAYELAKALRVSLEFIPFQYETFIDDLNNNKFDIAMSSVSVTEERLRHVKFTEAYLETPRALITFDYRRKEFFDSRRFAESTLRIGVYKGSSLVAEAEAIFPEATIVPFQNVEEFARTSQADAFLWTEIEGSTWSLQNPDYAVVIPSPSIGKEIYAYAIRPNSAHFLEYVNYWLEIKKLDGMDTRLRNKWVLGEPSQKERRWSIIRDVLHWVD